MLLNPFQPDWMPMRPTQAPVGGGAENQMNPFFGKPLSPNMMVGS